MTQPVSHEHFPVMLNEVIGQLNIQPNQSQLFIDATFGRGGYTKAILDASSQSKVIAFDQDPDAQIFAAEIKEIYKDRFHLAETNFREMLSYLSTQKKEHLFEKNFCVDGIAFDLGLSSPQLDNADRGFSIKQDGPIDMRMSKSGKSAFDVINSYNEKKLADIIYTYGEEKKSRQIAREIVYSRKIAEIKTTFELKKIIHKVIKPRFNQKIDPATRTFQAIRIYINDELNAFYEALIASEKLLKENGRLVIVSFHSLEDRIAKQFIQACSTAPETHNINPFAKSNKDTTFMASFTKITKKPIEASPTELAQNSRSRSAKLRSAQRTSHQAISPEIEFIKEINQYV